MQRYCGKIGCSPLDRFWHLSFVEGKNCIPLMEQLGHMRWRMRLPKIVLTERKNNGKTKICSFKILPTHITNLPVSCGKYSTLLGESTQKRKPTSLLSKFVDFLR